MVKSGLEKIFLKFLHALTMSFLLLNLYFWSKFSNKNNMVSAWRNFKNIFSRPLSIIIFRPVMVEFSPIFHFDQVNNGHNFSYTYLIAGIMIQLKLPTCGWTCPTVVGIIWNLPISSLFWANLCQIWECLPTWKDTIPLRPYASLVLSWWQVVTTTMAVILSRYWLDFTIFYKIMFSRCTSLPFPVIAYSKFVTLLYALKPDHFKKLHS